MSGMVEEKEFRKSCENISVSNSLSSLSLVVSDDLSFLDLHEALFI